MNNNNFYNNYNNNPNFNYNNNYNNFNNFQNNNYNKNIYNMNQNNYGNSPIQQMNFGPNNNSNNNQFTLYFIYKGKEVFLDTNPNIPFKNIHEALTEKYSWLGDINIKGFSFQNNYISLNSTCSQLNIQNGSKINIRD